MDVAQETWVMRNVQLVPSAFWGHGAGFLARVAAIGDCPFAYFRHAHPCIHVNDVLYDPWWKLGTTCYPAPTRYLFGNRLSSSFQDYLKFRETPATTL